MIGMRAATRKPVTIHDEVEAKRCALGRVVLIDDDLDILASLKALVDLSGYTSECHPSAAHFLQALAHGEPVYPGPCCVVSDVRMPDIDGLELLGQLQEIEELPLILMSGGSGIREAIDAFKLGVVDFLVKPFEMDAFLAAVSKGLVHQRPTTGTEAGTDGTSGARQRADASRARGGRHGRTGSAEPGDRRATGHIRTDGQDAPAKRDGEAERPQLRWACARHRPCRLGRGVIAPTVNTRNGRPMPRKIVLKKKELIFLSID